MDDRELTRLAALAGVQWFPHQQEFLESLPHRQQDVQKFRACLYYKTGSGKSLTSLAAVAGMGYDTCLVIAPPSTHKQWSALGDRMGVEVKALSHAKFRMKATPLSKSTPVIADEFHLFGGQQGQGWKKLDVFARHLKAPMILCSATPNYNDAERCYCVAHILNPSSVSGGYLQFLYQHCVTVQNPFSMMPLVEGFRDYDSAAEFLAAMPGVHYLEDDTEYEVIDVPYPVDMTPELDRYGYDYRSGRILASQMEERHVRKVRGLIRSDMTLQPEVLHVLLPLLDQSPVLLFAVHATIAAAALESLTTQGYSCGIVTGKTPKPMKDDVIQEFLDGTHQVLIGTASLATGTDGLDKVCDRLVILDDTDDDALRRQLMGRILPRGDVSSAQPKSIYRLNPL